MDYKSLLKKKIETYISYKNEITARLEGIENLRKQKNNIENEINTLLSKHKLENKTFMINDNKIKQREITISKALSIKYIKHILEDYNCNVSRKIDTDEIVNYIVHNRPKNKKVELIIY